MPDSLRHIALCSAVVLALACSQATSHKTERAQTAPAPPSTAPIAKAQRGQARTPTPKEQEAIARLMRLAERVRGLRFIARVPVAIENAEAVMDYARSELRRDELENARTIYVALNMLPAHLDIEELLVSLLGEQVVGYYDARQGRLVVRDDVIAGLGAEDQDVQSLAAREVLLHELVHALQDQHFGLRERLDEKRSSDGENAFRALVEGDAMLAVAGFAAQQAGVPLRALIGDRERMHSLATAITQAATASPLLSDAPAIVREPLLSAYRDGLMYTAHLYLTNNSFTAVDAAYQAPPTTMREVLHPELQKVSSAPPSLPSELKILGSEYSAVTQESLGELELFAYLSSDMPAKRARAAAEGWTGDAVQVYRDAAGHVMALWLVQQGSQLDAQELANAAREVQESRCKRVCDDQHVTQRDLQVLIGHGLSRTLFEQAATTLFSAP